MKKAAFGTVVQKERLRLGLSLSEAARQMGVSKQYLHRVEQAEMCPSLDKADMMLRGLGLSAVIGVLDKRKRVSFDSEAR